MEMSNAKIAAPSSNWKALRTALRPPGAAASPPTTSRKRARTDSFSPQPEARKSAAIKGKGKERESSVASLSEDARAASGTKKKKELLPIDSIMEGGTAAWQAEPGQYLAMDCEMVGVGPEGSESTLARVSIVNYHGVVILDRFVRPREKVTDYRTWVSGVREEDLRNAPTFAEVQKEVAALLNGRILVGHALSNDTQVLLLSHPRHMTRDTAKYVPLQTLARTKKPGLKTLAKLVLGIDIQTGEHSSVLDARATMAIYRSQKTAWEDALRTHSTPALVRTTTAALAALDPTSAALSGNGTSKRRAKNLGIAATLRLARAEAAVAVEMDADEADERARKKARVEAEEGLVVGFDYAPVPVPVVKKAAVVVNGVGEKKSAGEKRVKKVSGRAFKGDREKRPKSKEGWWEEI